MKIQQDFQSVQPEGEKPSGRPLEAWNLKCLHDKISHREGKRQVVNREQIFTAEPAVLTLWTWSYKISYKSIGQTTH